jgi:ABC-type transport system involved in multi-copper enzyme maturation permease subunit
MRQLRALLIDSLRETLDRKLFLLVIVLTSLPILFCASLEFLQVPLEQNLPELATRLNRFNFYGVRGSPGRHPPEAHVTVENVYPVPATDEWPADVHGGHVIAMAFGEPRELDKLVAYVNRMKTFIFSRRPPPKAGEEEPAATPEQKMAFMDEQFKHFGFNHVFVKHVEAQGAPSAEPADGAPSAEPADGAKPAVLDRFLIAVRTDYPLEIRGAHRLSLLFGLFPNVYLRDISIAEFTIRLQQGLAQIFSGLVVMVVALLVTAGFVPDMLRRGTLDLLLARPLGRVRLLLSKYVGGLWFISIFATFLISGSWIALSIRSGYWNPWFLFSIVTVLATFAVLSSVSVLVGVVTRSPGAAAMIAIGVWAVSGVVVGLHHTIQTMLYGTEVPDLLKRIFEWGYVILPKTTDLTHLNTYALSRSYLSPEAFVRTFGRELPPVDWVFSLGTTAAFTAVMLGLAAWVFRRKDY